jgi:hypothetical protein
LPLSPDLFPKPSPLSLPFPPKLSSPLLKPLTHGLTRCDPLWLACRYTPEVRFIMVDPEMRLEQLLKALKLRQLPAGVTLLTPEWAVDSLSDKPPRPRPWSGYIIKALTPVEKPAPAPGASSDAGGGSDGGLFTNGYACVTSGSDAVNKNEHLTGPLKAVMEIHELNKQKRFQVPAYKKVMMMMTLVVEMMIMMPTRRSTPT